MYHHFDSKEAVLRAVLGEEWALQMVPVLDELRNEQLPPRDRLHMFLASYLRHLAEVEEFRQLAVLSTVVAPQAVNLDDGAYEKRQALQGWRELLIPLLAACQPLHGAMTENDAVFVIFTFVHGLTLTAAVEPAQLPTGAAREAITAAVLSGLTSDPSETLQDIS